MSHCRSPEQNRIIASHYTGVTPKVSYDIGGRTAPWAPKMSHLHTHAEESGGDVFTELFGNDVRDSYEANSGVDFDYILHDSCVSYLRQWVRHVQLSNNALRLKHGMPRAVAPPVLEALLTRGLTVATCGTDLRKAAVRYAADLIASNKKLRNSSLNGCKTDSVKLAEPQKLLLSPIKKRNKVAADVENDTDQCAPQTPAVMKQFNQIDITEINQEELTGESLSHIIRPLELGYSVSRYYVNPVCHVDHNYNTSDINRNQPHPSDLVILKKNLFS